MSATKRVESFLIRERIRAFLSLFLVFLCFAVFFLVANLNKPSTLLENQIGVVYLAFNRVTPASGSSGDSQTANQIIVEMRNDQKITVTSPSTTKLPRKGDQVIVKKYKNRFFGFSYRYAGKNEI